MHSLLLAYQRNELQILPSLCSALGVVSSLLRVVLCLQANESGSDDDDKSENYAGKSKRVLANRQSAHRSRLRKLQYIQDLENNVNRIQTEISQIQPQLTFLRDKYSGMASLSA